MRRRLGVAVAAVMLGAQIGSPAVASEPNVEQLTLISQYIEAGDLEALILFLEENPELLEGDSLVAQRLREFMLAAQDLAGYLAFDPPMRQALADSIFASLAEDGDSGRPLEEGSSLY